MHFNVVFLIGNAFCFFNNYFTFFFFNQLFMNTFIININFQINIISFGDQKMIIRM